MGRPLGGPKGEVCLEVPLFLFGSPRRLKSRPDEERERHLCFHPTTLMGVNLIRAPLFNRVSLIFPFLRYPNGGSVIPSD